MIVRLIPPPPWGLGRIGWVGRDRGAGMCAVVGGFWRMVADDEVLFG
jgi:hypothetical protein